MDVTLFMSYWRKSALRSRTTLASHFNTPPRACAQHQAGPLRVRVGPPWLKSMTKCASECIQVATRVPF